MKATAIANSNIAFVKYWGKSDIQRNLPMNPSISMTLDENFSTKTTVEFSKKYEEDIFLLNNEIQKGNKLQRVSDFLDLITEMNAKVVSMNTFPTGAGIASSASGFAALAAAAVKALGIEMSQKELSALARQGSGSAARSIQGGFVEWKKEYSEQLYDKGYWSELRDVVVIVKDTEKEIGSSEGMQLTVKTSEKYMKRIKNIHPTLDGVKKALSQKKFKELAKLIMQDSDSMHECMLDTTPKLKYMNEKSEKIKEIIKNMNNEKVIAAYTFDAGANAHIITLEKFVGMIRDEMSTISDRIYVSGPGKGIRYTQKHLR